jgi:uncharacterized protein YndB with AHSA1/START domain
MNQAMNLDPGAIVVDDVFPHTPEVIWRALTDGTLIGRWLMAPIGFAPEIGNRFTYQTKPAGEWDGTIQCEVLDVVPNERLSYAWRGGHASNGNGYGSKLDTVVTFTLEKAEAGTRLRLIHSGFVLPRNDVAYRNMSDGWTKVIDRLDAVLDDTSTQAEQ